MEIVGRQEATLEHYAVRRSAWASYPHARERVIERVADIGAVEDLPVLKVAASAKADAAGANAAERTGDAGQLTAAMNSWKSDLLRCPRWLRRHARLGFSWRGGRLGTLRTGLFGGCCDTAE